MEGEEERKFREYLETLDEDKVLMLKAINASQIKDANREFLDKRNILKKKVKDHEELKISPSESEKPSEL